MFEKIKNKMLVASAAITPFALAVPAFAAEGDNMQMTTTELGQVISTVTGVINVQTIVGFVAAILAVSLVFALMWFGIRKALSSIMGSVRRGRVGA